MFDVRLGAMGIVLTPYDAAYRTQPQLVYNAAVDAFINAPPSRPQTPAPHIAQPRQDNAFERFCGWLGGLLDGDA